MAVDLGNVTKEDLVQNYEASEKISKLYDGLIYPLAYVLISGLPYPEADDIAGHISPTFFNDNGSPINKTVGLRTRYNSTVGNGVDLRVSQDLLKQFSGNSRIELNTYAALVARNSLDVERTAKNYKAHKLVLLGKEYFVGVVVSLYDKSLGEMHIARAMLPSETQLPIAVSQDVPTKLDACKWFEYVQEITKAASDICVTEYAQIYAEAYSSLYKIINNKRQDKDNWQAA
jgi:hypothetical protein